ncbi:MAG TPA: hypothetical protein PK691_08515, partial [Thermomicrobiales bacterium]|nr:hypothetical protein [Thermomicrobiales bacterium]
MDRIRITSVARLLITLLMAGGILAACGRSDDDKGGQPAPTAVPTETAVAAVPTATKAAEVA